MQVIRDGIRIWLEPLLDCSVDFLMLVVLELEGCAHTAMALVRLAAAVVYYVFLALSCGVSVPVLPSVLIEAFGCLNVLYGPGMRRVFYAGEFDFVDVLVLILCDSHAGARGL